MRLYKRKDVWWIDYHAHGQRYRESSGSKRKKDAKAMLEQRLREKGMGRRMVEQDKVTLDRLLTLVEQEYERRGRKSIERLRIALKHLRAGFPGWTALSVDTEAVWAYETRRLRAGASASSIQKEIAGLKRAFRLGIRANLVSARPFDVTIEDVDNVRTNWISQADMESICQHAAPHIVAPIRFVRRRRSCSGVSQTMCFRCSVSK